MKSWESDSAAPSQSHREKKKRPRVTSENLPFPMIYSPPTFAGGTPTSAHSHFRLAASAGACELPGVATFPLTHGFSDRFLGHVPRLPISGRFQSSSPVDLFQLLGAKRYTSSNAFPCQEGSENFFAFDNRETFPGDIEDELFGSTARTQAAKPRIHSGQSVFRSQSHSTT